MLLIASIARLHIDLHLPPFVVSQKKRVHPSPSSGTDSMVSPTHHTRIFHRKHPHRLSHCCRRHLRVSALQTSLSIRGSDLESTSSRPSVRFARLQRRRTRQQPRCTKGREALFHLESPSSKHGRGVAIQASCDGNDDEVDEKTRRFGRFVDLERDVCVMRAFFSSRMRVLRPGMREPRDVLC